MAQRWPRYGSVRCRCARAQYRIVRADRRGAARPRRGAGRSAGMRAWTWRRRAPRSGAAMDGRTVTARGGSWRHHDHAADHADGAAALAALATAGRRRGSAAGRSRPGVTGGGVDRPGAAIRRAADRGSAALRPERGSIAKRRRYEDMGASGKARPEASVGPKFRRRIEKKATRGADARSGGSGWRWLALAAIAGAMRAGERGGRPQSWRAGAEPGRAGPFGRARGPRYGSRPETALAGGGARARAVQMSGSLLAGPKQTAGIAGRLRSSPKR